MGIPLGPALAGAKGTHPKNPNCHLECHPLFGSTNIPSPGILFSKGQPVGSKGASTATSSSDSSSSNYCYLILFNLNKKNNLGAILRSAAAFGVRLVLLVGRQGFKALPFLGGNVGQGVKDEMDEMDEMNEMN